MISRQIFAKFLIKLGWTDLAQNPHILYIKNWKPTYVKLKAIPIFRRNCSKWFLFFIELSSKGDRKKFKGISYLE